MRYAFVLLVLLLGSAQAAEQVRLTNGEWPPYLGETLPHHGVASRIVAEAFALQGIDVQWEFHPWARSLKMAEQGVRDGSAVWFHSPERERHFHISEPVVESGYYLFHRKPLRSDSLHLLLSREVPGNDELMQRFNRGLNQLRDSGKISQYLLEIQQPLSLSH